MVEVTLKGHEKYYATADVLRLFFAHPTEDKAGGRVYCECPENIKIESILLPSGKSICRIENRDYGFSGTPLEEGREVKRSLYLALSSVTGRTFPWGCLTGIRPTLVAGEETSPEELVRKYMVREDKARLAFDTARAENALVSGSPAGSLNIYVGVPFCPSRCEYCSFISQDISSHMKRLGEYKDALISELKLIGPSINRPVDTLYMGGGTPTVFSDSDFAEVISCMTSVLPLSSSCEITVEAGRPDTITPAKLSAMRAAGIERICINPQTFADATLEKLNRRHTAADTVETFNLARRLGFKVINMDLIAGLKYETASDFLFSLEQALDLGPENITIHTLYKKRRAAMSREDVLDEDNARGDVDSAVSAGYEKLVAAGYKPYYLYRQKDTGHGLENTGFEKGGTGCRYNVAMMTDSRDVLSFGAGGMSKRVFGQIGTSKYRVERCSCTKDVLDYMSRVDEIAAKKTSFFEM